MFTVTMSSDTLEIDGQEFSISLGVNDRIITGRSCYNTGETDGEGRHKYQVDTGEIVWHDRDEGAVALAKKLLDTIEDPAIPPSASD